MFFFVVQSRFYKTIIKNRQNYLKKKTKENKGNLYTSKHFWVQVAFLDFQLGQIIIIFAKHTLQKTLAMLKQILFVELWCIMEMAMRMTAMTNGQRCQAYLAINDLSWNCFPWIYFAITQGFTSFSLNLYNVVLNFIWYNLRVNGLIIEINLERVICSFFWISSK